MGKREKRKRRRTRRRREEEKEGFAGAVKERALTEKEGERKRGREEVRKAEMRKRTGSTSQ